MTGHPAAVTSLEASYEWLLSGSSDKTVHLWQLSIPSFKQLKGHEGPVVTIGIENSMIVSGSTSVRVWNTEVIIVQFLTFLDWTM